MRTAISLILFVQFCAYNISGQDSLHTNRPNTLAYVTSTSLMTLGVITNKQEIKTNFREWVRRRYEVPQTGIDDYLQHAPVVMLYGSALLSKVGKSELERQTRHWIASEVTAIGTALLLKEIINDQRPNGGSHSFPSGHTTHAFTGATVLFYAFRDKNKWLAYSGYIPAIATGAYRIIKDKHWVSDVLFGAGLGVLSTAIIYELNIWNARKSNKERQNFTSLHLGMTPNGLGLTVKL